MGIARRLIGKVVCEVAGHKRWAFTAPGQGHLMFFVDSDGVEWRSFEHCQRCGAIYLSGVGPYAPRRIEHPREAPEFNEAGEPEEAASTA